MPSVEGFRDESGLFGVYGHREAAHFAYVGLHALQERGGDGAGIVSSDGDLLRAVHGAGLVQEVFGGPHLQALTGQHAIGQVVRVAASTASRAQVPDPHGDRSNGVLSFLLAGSILLLTSSIRPSAVGSAPGGVLAGARPRRLKVEQ